MAGLANTGGGLLDGWAHVRQSIEVILKTPIGSRVMRRDFGSRVPHLIDAPMNGDAAMALYASVAEALDKWEPRFELREVTLVGDNAAEMSAGRIGLRLVGVYHPRGHLGDFETRVDGDRDFAVLVR